MRQTFTTAIVLMGVAAALLWLSLKKVDATPAAASVPSEVDLGVGVRGASLRGDIEVRNTSSSQPMKIAKVWSSCGCTTLGEDAFTIPPGKMREIPVRMKLSGGSRNAIVRLHPRSGGPIEVTVRGRAAEPIPQKIAVQDEGRIVIPLHDAYQGFVSAVDCYFYPSDAPTPCRVTEQTSGWEETLVVDGPPESHRLDVVFTLNGSVEEQIARQVRLIPEHRARGERRDESSVIRTKGDSQ